MRFLTAVIFLLGFAVPTHAADKGLGVPHAPRGTSNSASHHVALVAGHVQSLNEGG